VGCARNRFIFNDLKECVHNSVAKINSLRSFCDVAFDIQMLDSVRTTNLRHVAWSKPEAGTICLNVDGSMLGSVNAAGFGGLIRNSAGTFLGGCYGTTVQPNILYAEIMAVLHGLELCWNKGCRKVVCYSDSLQAVKLINEDVLP
jgi:ribonuclease HI